MDEQKWEKPRRPRRADKYIEDATPDQTRTMNLSELTEEDRSDEKTQADATPDQTRTMNLSELTEGDLSDEKTLAEATPDQTRTMNLSELAEKNRSDEKTQAEHPDEISGSEQDGSETQPEDAVALAQAAENRVPARARQMSADPYGAISTVSAAAVRRPAVRPQSQTRPSLPERENRQRVGYAPGRMSESMVRQHREAARTEAGDARNSRDERNGRIGNRDERNGRIGNRDERSGRNGSRNAVGAGTRMQDYPENRYEKPAAKAYLEKGKKKNARRIWILLLAVVLLLVGLVAAARFVLPEDHAIRRTVVKYLPFLDSKKKQDPIQVSSFTVSGNESPSAPADITFSVVTTRDVESIRLTDEEGRPLETTLAQGTNNDDRVWIMKLHLDNGYQGAVRLQARREGGEWQDTGETQILSIGVSLNDSGATDGTAGNGLPLAQETETPAPLSQLTPEPADGVEGPERTGAEDAEAEDRALQGMVSEGTASESGEEETEDGYGTKNLTASAGQVPVLTEIPTPTETPAPTAAPTATPALTVEASEEASPDLLSVNQVYSGSKVQKNYSRPAKELIHMPVGDEYTRQPMGVLTFRGDNFRRNAACGTVSGAEGLAVAWTVETGSARGANITYYGVGWTGQAAIVKWSKEVRQKSNIDDDKKEVSGLKEVIVAGLDGSVRYMDLSDGKLTRNSTKVGYPLRGTPSLHPGGYPYMNIGQYARKMKNKTGKIGLRQYNLYSQKELTLIDGLDGKLHRAYNNVGSFNTSSLIDRTSDTVITAGDNGMLYLIALNSDFDYQAGVYKMSPSTVVLRSKAKNQKDALTAVQSSLAAYDKYVFYADMSGILRCVDTDFLKPVWAVKTGDAVKAAVALDLDQNRQLSLYTANMLENRKTGSVQIRRYDALSGRNTWTTEIGVVKGKKETQDVGAKASPVIGQNALSSLVYFTVTGLSSEGASTLGLTGGPKSALIALNKETGAVVWACGMAARAESSPVAVYAESGEGWIIQCAEDGTVVLLRGLTGQLVSTLSLDGQIEASPAVYNDMMVISTTGKGDTYVYGIKILGGENSASSSQQTAVTPTPQPLAEENEPVETETGGEEPYEEEPYEEQPDDDSPGEDASGIG